MADRGGQLGNTNSAKAKPWAEAVRKALLEEDPRQKRKKLEIAARALVKQGCAGDVSALKEIGDRMDGKVKQQIEHGGDPDNPIRQRIERVIVDPADTRPEEA